MPALVNPDGTMPTHGQLWPAGGWSTLPPGLDGLEGVEVWPVAGGVAWFVAVGSAAWAAWSGRASLPMPVPVPARPLSPIYSPPFKSAFDGGSPITADFDPLPLTPPPVVLPPNVIPPEGTEVPDAIEDESTCGCSGSPTAGRSLWWLVLAGIVLWLM